MIRLAQIGFLLGLVILLGLVGGSRIVAHVHAIVTLFLFAWAVWLMARNQLWPAALIALVGIVKVLP